MSIIKRASTITLICLALFSLGSGPEAFADESDSKIQKRIAELEAENRALRKIIAELKSGHQSGSTAKVGGLRIIVLKDDWGGSSVADMQKVCESAARPIASQFINDGFAPILVQRSKSGPITLYKRGEGNEFIVRLDSADRAWAQLAYQFSHEFCHIACNYRNAKNPQLWFEETLCECASIFSLRAMAEEWKTNPPYSNWKSYSSSLASYANDRITQHGGPTESIADFYKANLAELKKSGTNRQLNGYIAVKLLPLFEASPTGWQSLRYLNLGSTEENNSFEAYLSAWHERVPKQHKKFVTQIANEFDIQLTNHHQSE